MTGSSYFRSRVFLFHAVTTPVCVLSGRYSIIYSCALCKEGESMPEMLPDDRPLGKWKVMPYDVAYKEQDKHGVGHETQIKWPG